MKIKDCYLQIAVLVSCFIALPTVAKDGLSANIGATNNYLWRGISQSSDKAAFSGGIDYTQSAFTIGTWLSNADWADNMSYELDLYASYGNEINSELSYSLGYIYYLYDRDANSDFSEINAAITYQDYTFSYHTLITSDSKAGFADDYYLEASTSMQLVSGFELALHIGSYHYKYAKDYLDYSASITKNGFSFTVSDTNLSGADGDVNFVISYSQPIEL